MEDSDKKLIKILNRERRELKEEINYLRDVLWTITNGTAFEEPAISTRTEEPVAPMLIDGLCREILEGK